MKRFFSEVHGLMGSYPHLIQHGVRSDHSSSEGSSDGGAGRACWTTAESAAVSHIVIPADDIS